MIGIELLSENTRIWLEEKNLEGKALRRFVTKRLEVPRYTRIRKKPWEPSEGTRFATGDDIEKISNAVRTAYGSTLGEEYVALSRLEGHIRANEIVRASGYEPAFCCIREKSPGQLVFLMAEIRRYKKTPKEHFDIEYFWIYNWVSTIADDSVAPIAILKDLRSFYGHLCSRAKRPLNLRARTHQKTSFRIRDRIRRTFERELARRGMESTFELAVRKRKDENIYLTMNNSLNQELDAARRKERAAAAQEVSEAEQPDRRFA
ncbi:MAG: hypothetical protein ACR2Q4_00380 [Geminicoccaceae bacterium]